MPPCGCPLAGRGARRALPERQAAAQARTAPHARERAAAAAPASCARRSPRGQAHGLAARGPWPPGRGRGSGQWWEGRRGGGVVARDGREGQGQGRAGHEGAARARGQGRSGRRSKQAWGAAQQRQAAGSGGTEKEGTEREEEDCQVERACRHCNRPHQPPTRRSSHTQQQQMRPSSGKVYVNQSGNTVLTTLLPCSVRTRSYKHIQNPLSHLLQVQTTLATLRSLFHDGAPREAARCDLLRAVPTFPLLLAPGPAGLLARVAAPPPRTAACAAATSDDALAVGAQDPTASCSTCRRAARAGFEASGAAGLQWKGTQQRAHSASHHMRQRRAPASG